MSRSGDEKVSLVDLGRERPQVPATARNMSPIVPRASISGRALVAVVAIMTFLASLTTGTVLLVSASAAEWQSEVSSEITIQVRPSPGRDLDRDAQAAVEAMRAQPGILEVRPFSKEESAKLLEPWLGSGLSIDELPVPRVIVARVQPGTTLDLAGLRARVTQVAPTASVDDHRAWIERMRSMTGATVFAGVGILILVIIATIISVSFATRGAMASNRPIVEVLHFVGAGDSFIANRFPAAFPPARSRGRADRRRRGDACVRLLRVDRQLVLRHAGGRPVRGSARHVLAASVGLPRPGVAGGADRGDHRMGVAAHPVRHARRHRLTARGVAIMGPVS
ncbi:cell division transport system permease protein [Bradyrhizobium sp. USDA 3240]